MLLSDRATRERAVVRTRYVCVGLGDAAHEVTAIGLALTSRAVTAA